MPGSDEFKQLADLIAGARLVALRKANARLTGDLETRFTNPTLDRVYARRNAKAKAGETIAELFESYVAQKVAEKGKRLAGADQDRMVIGQFVDFVGAERSIGSVTYEDAKGFTDALAKVPAGYKKVVTYRGLSVRQAIAQGETEGAKGMALTTQNRYISALSGFFAWLASEHGGRRIKANPFDGLAKNVSRLKGDNPRPPFTAEMIIKIIHSPLFTGFERDGREHRKGNERADDWRYWLPLLCLFTGARIGEVAQLHVADISKMHGIWCVDFRHAPAEGQQIKNGRGRSVALHSTLLKIGFLLFVDRQRARSAQDGNSQLFPEVTEGRPGQYGDDPSKWWRKYLFKIGLKSAKGDGYGSHSFRHTMADQLRAAGHLDAVFGTLILGHTVAGSKVTRGYGETQQGTPQMISKMIESVRFVPIERGRAVEGGQPVDFSHLYVDQTESIAEI